MVDIITVFKIINKHHLTDGIIVLEDILANIFFNKMDIRILERELFILLYAQRLEDRKKEFERQQREKKIMELLAKLEKSTSIPEVIIKEAKIDVLPTFFRVYSRYTSSS